MTTALALSLSVGVGLSLKAGSRRHYHRYHHQRRHRPLRGVFPPLAQLSTADAIPSDSSSLSSAAGTPTNNNNGSSSSSDVANDADNLFAADGIGKPRLARGSKPPARRQPLEEYLRLVEEPDGSWELQSATAVFRGKKRSGREEREGAVVEVALAATVHVGDASYYAGLQEECESNYDCVLFELITSEENLRPGRAPRPRCSLDARTCDDDDDDDKKTNTSSSGAEKDAADDEGKDDEEEEDDFLPTLAVQLGPTQDARELADVHGLCAQLDALDLRREGWFVADLPKAELVRLQEEAGERARSTRSSQSRTSRSSSSSSSSSSLPPALEALVITARGRAGGGPLRQGTRALCWLVPCPEAHLLLLDWVWGGGRPAPVLGAMLDSLAGGNLTAARRLAFAQMIVSAQAKGNVGGGADVPVLVTRRNQVAVDCLRKAIAAKDVSRVGLLYGGLHMPGLTKSVMNDLGLEPADQRWRAVWRVEAPSRSPAVRWLALPALLAADGTDWASTLNHAVGCCGDGAVLSAALAVGLYVVRHGALYYTLGKWVLEWNKQLFDGGAGESEDGFQG